jgi:hypothetical protein
MVKVKKVKQTTSKKPKIISQKPVDTATVSITMTVDQAYVLMNAMEFYARIHIGQFDTLDTEFAWNGIDCNGNEREFWRNDDARTQLRWHLNEARSIIFPELESVGANGSHGIVSDGISPDAHEAWDIYQVVRRELAIHRDPNPTDYSVSYNSPLKTSTTNPLPKVRIGKRLNCISIQE